MPFEGLDERIADVERAPSEVRRITDEQLVIGAEDVLTAVRAGTPVQSGQTASAWQVQRVAELRQRVFNPFNHVRFLRIDESRVNIVLRSIDRKIERQIDALLQEA